VKSYKLGDAIYLALAMLLGFALAAGNCAVPEGHRFDRDNLITDAVVVALIFLVLFLARRRYKRG
jgi:uncharacterized membrane protein YozB (DUF420 family)